MNPSDQFICLLSAASTLVASLVLTPVVRSVARRIGFVDKPDGGRKTHKEAVALGGGVAVGLSALIGIGVAVRASFAWDGGVLVTKLCEPIRLAMFGGAVLIVLLGLIDDAIALKGRYKLLGQVLIAGILVYSGLRIENFSLLGGYYELGSLAIPVTLFWLLGTINAINLIDGIDGLAGSVGVVLCLSVGSIMFLIPRPVEVLLLVVLASALLGFLRYNFAPASIYLGDAGSMLIGLIIGVVAIPGNAKSALAVGMIAPVAVWSIPILDSAAAILRRKLTGRSLFAADRGHLHHSLLTRGWTVRQASTFIALICATTGLGAVLSVRFHNELIALVTVAGVILYLIFTKTFGHIEYSLVRDQISYNTLSTAPEATGRERTVRLQGSREWEKLWEAITEQADRHHLTRVKLSINMPALNEVFFATWNSTATVADDDQKWKTSLPLMLDGQKVGEFELAGVAADERKSSLAQILRSLDFLEPIEEDIRQIRERIRVERQEVRVGKPAVSEADDATAAPAVHH